MIYRRTSLGAWTPIVEESLLPPIVRDRCQGRATQAEYEECARAYGRKLFRNDLIMAGLLGGGLLGVAMFGGWKKLFGVTALSVGGLMYVGKSDLWRAA